MLLSPVVLGLVRSLLRPRVSRSVESRSVKAQLVVDSGLALVQKEQVRMTAAFRGHSAGDGPQGQTRVLLSAAGTS